MGIYDNICAGFLFFFSSCPFIFISPPPPSPSFISPIMKVCPIVYNKTHDVIYLTKKKFVLYFCVNC